MMRVLSWLLFWSVLTGQALSLVTLPHVPRQQNTNAIISTPKPSEDPWYRPTANWTSTTPGTVLKVRTSPYSKPLIIGHCIDTFQILYRTTDSHQNASWAVTTVFIPLSHQNCNSTPSACSHGIVSYQVPYDSADLDAAASYLLQYGEPYGEINDLLVRGYFISVPDFEGPLSSYCAGVQSGHATLDGAKAVMQVAPDFGLVKDKAKIALWGYSGGALATEFAAELAASHAPDLQLAGALIGGPAPNLTTVGQMLNNQSTAGLITGILGITSQHAEARNWMLSRLYTSGPYNATTFLSALHMNAVEALTTFMYTDVYKFFASGKDDLYAPIMMNMYNRDGVMGFHGTPNMPVFLYKAINDEMSPLDESDNLVQKYCDQGANILYHRNNIGGHNQELWGGRDRVMKYLSTVLDGTNALEVPNTGCQTVNLTVACNVSVASNGTLLVDPLDVVLLDNGTLVLKNEAPKLAAKGNKLGVSLER